MIDEIDHKILNILQKNARIPNVDVARQVGMAPSAVLERIRKLEKQGVIEGYEVRLNPRRFDRNMVAFVTVMVQDLRRQHRIASALAAIGGVQEVHLIAGEDAFLVKLRVEGPEALGRLLTDEVGAIEGVSGTRSSIVLATYKETARIPIDNTRE